MLISMLLLASMLLPMSSVHAVSGTHGVAGFRSVVGPVVPGVHVIDLAHAVSGTMLLQMFLLLLALL